MNKQEIQQRITALTDTQRSELYRLCEARKRRNQHGVDDAVYETVSEDVAETLHQQDLVWLIGSTLAAARHDVYGHWKKHIDAPALQ